MTTARYGASAAAVTPAAGVTGFLLKSTDWSFFFRVYLILKLRSLQMRSHPFTRSVTGGFLIIAPKFSVWRVALMNRNSNP